jgi:hypothetical protein
MILTRFAYLAQGTLGRLHSADPGAVQLYTLERPWQGNAPYLSCIPEGVYQLAPHHGAHWVNVIELLDVAGRSSILIHPANKPVELQGCIAPGLSCDVGLCEVRQSVDAFKKIMAWFDSGDRQLTITGVRT